MASIRKQVKKVTRQVHRAVNYAKNNDKDESFINVSDYPIEVIEQVIWAMTHLYGYEFYVQEYQKSNCSMLVIRFDSTSPTGENVWDEAMNNQNREVSGFVDYSGLS